MTETKAEKIVAVVEPFSRYTPAEAARNKKARDERRKVLRARNIQSKMMK